MITTNALKEKSKTLVRQKSFMDHHGGRKIPLNRSKTPPPRLNHGSQSLLKSHHVDKPTAGKNVSTTCTLPRNHPSKVKSLEELNLMNTVKLPSKSNKDVITREDTLELRYNIYLQNCLMIAHSKNVQKRKENKVIKQLEDIETRLLAIDEKMINLTVDAEKLKLYKQLKEKLEKEIKDYETLNGLIDSNQTEERILALEHDLNILQLQNFYISDSIQDSHKIVNYLMDISGDLKLLPHLEKNILPLTNLHSSLVKTRENFQEEVKLRKSCEKKLKEAEELIITDCFMKSLSEI